MTPEEAARARQAAIEQLQAQLSRNVDIAQQELLRGLLVRLQDTLTDPYVVVELMAEYQRVVAPALAASYAKQLLTLPGLSESYFQELGVADYAKLRAPAVSFLEQRFGITAAGGIIPGGELSTIIGDYTAQREVMRYAFQAQATGIGLKQYRKGLEELVTGGDIHTNGLIQRLHKASYDDFNKADRVIQHIAADELNLGAYLYQGGLIKSSRPFCVVRNGKCFTTAEVKLFGTAKDTYGGYTNKAEGEFSGKTDPYAPLVDAGGHSCRHGYSAVPNVVALRMRPDLTENDKGELVAR